MVLLAKYFSAFIFHSNVHLLSSTFWHMLIYIYIHHSRCGWEGGAMESFHLWLTFCGLVEGIVEEVRQIQVAYHSKK